MLWVHLLPMSPVYTPEMGGESSLKGLFLLRRTGICPEWQMH